MSRPIPPHGTNARYQSKAAPCRCPSCRAAHALDWRKRRHAMKPWTNVRTIVRRSEPEHIGAILPRVLDRIGGA